MSGYAEAKPEIARQIIEVDFILGKKFVGLNDGRIGLHSVKRNKLLILSPEDFSLPNNVQRRTCCHAGRGDAINFVDWSLRVPGSISNVSQFIGS